MRLTKLFNTQRKLDNRIVEEKGLEGVDLLPRKVLSLQVELGECANEWKGFKFWKENPRSNTTENCRNCSGKGEGFFSGGKWTGKKEICEECNGTGIEDGKNPLLEEYVDCLHFILSIGIDTDEENVKVVKYEGYQKNENPTDAFLDVFESVAKLDMEYYAYGDLVSRFVELGELLGFTWEEVESAYFKKNVVNHQRQDSGY